MSSITVVVIHRSTHHPRNIRSIYCLTSYKYSPTCRVTKMLAQRKVVLQRKPFAFELFFCLANAGFFTFSLKTRSIVWTSNLCRNVQGPKSQLNL